MNLGRRLLVASTLLTTACAAVVLGVTASAALAQSATDKTAGFNACRNLGFSVKTCCHNLGGAYEAEYDSHGNLIGESCTFHSDASQASQGPGLAYASPIYAIPPTGADTSGTNSGGLSNAGVYGLIQIFVPADGPPVIYYSTG